MLREVLEISGTAPCPTGVEPPLSYLQLSRLRSELYDQLYQDHRTANAVGCAFQFDGELTLVSLKIAAGEVIRRHEILRTSFSYHLRIGKGRISNLEAVKNLLSTRSPLRSVVFEQEKDATYHLEIPCHDLTDLTPQARTAQIRNCVTAIITEPFDLAMTPHIRLVLLAIQPTRHLLLVAMPRAVSDTQSLTLFGQELGYEYSTALGGLLRLRCNIEGQYGDFALWQREHLRGATLERLSQYWRKQFAEYSPVRPGMLPIARTLELKQDAIGPGAESVVLDNFLASQLGDLLSKRSSNLHILGLTIVAILVHLRTNQTKLAIWTSFSNRCHEPTQRLIGPFATSCIVGFDFCDDASLDDLLTQGVASYRSAETHQGLPIGLIAEDIAGTWSRIPCVSVEMESNPAIMSLRHLSITPVPIIPHLTYETLSFLIGERSGKLTFTVEYCQSRFERSGIRAMLARLEWICSQLVNSRGTRLSQMRCLRADNNQ